MKDLLDLILQNITTHPEEAKVDTSAEGDVEVYTITVNPEDMGRVIGKDGKVIRAIRSLAHVVAIRQGKRFRVTLNDVQAESAAPAETAPDTPKAPQTEPEVTDADTAEDLIAGAIDVSDVPPKKADSSK